MSNGIVLTALERLENFRKQLENREIAEGCTDWVVRSCQAIVAEGSFTNRSEWTEELENLH